VNRRGVVSQVSGRSDDAESVYLREARLVPFGLRCRDGRGQKGKKEKRGNEVRRKEIRRGEF